MIIKKVKVNGYKNLNIDWDLSKSGNIITVLGKNASGKTNLLEALMGFSNVADNSKSIKPNFQGEMELEIDGKTVWINGQGVFQKAAVEAVNRKSSKKTVEEFDIPDMLRVSVSDDFAPRYFTAQRRFRRFDEKDIRFSVFNEIKYGDDFIPFLLYLFAFSKDSYVRKILLDQFGIEGIAPIIFRPYYKTEELDSLLEPTKSYLNIIKNFFLDVDKYSDISKNTFTEENLRSLASMYGYENDYFDALHALLSCKFNKLSSALSVDTIKIIKHNKEIAISDLSDGEKQLIYILAIMTYYVGKNTIILFDEPDTHIYPTLQMSLIDYIKEINDKANVIITTHSPYIVSSLNKEDVFYLDDGEIFPVSNTKGKDINSIMIEIFNTPVRYPETNKRINQIYESLGKEKLLKVEKKEILEQINALALDLGESDYDIITMRAIINNK